MKKGLWCAVSFLFIFIPCGLSAQEYSLNQLYLLALERSGTIQIAEEDFDIAKREEERAVSALYPTLSAFGVHTRYSEEKFSSGFLLQPETRNNWGLRLNQSLSLSGREFTALQIAKRGVGKTRLDLYSTKEDYLLNVASFYYDVLKSKKALEIASDNLKRLDKHRNAAMARLEAGEVTKTAILWAEAELSAAKSELIKSENLLRLSLSVLARSVGIKGNISVKEPVIVIRKETVLSSLIGGCRLSPLDCLKEKAFTGRTEIKSMSFRKDIARKKVKYARGAFWPDISLEGVYARQEDNPDSAFGLREQIYGALRFDFPFFEGGLRVAESRQAKSKLRQTEYGLTDLKRTIEIEVESAYLSLITFSAVITQLQAETGYAEENFKTITKRFEYGLSDSIDVIDANTVLVRAELKLAGAEHDLQLASIQLKRSTGMLLKEVLGVQFEEQ